MSLHRSLNEQPVLVASIVVVVDVAFNGRDQLFPISEGTPVVALTFQGSPEPFHRAIVNAAANTRHALRHSAIQQLLVKDPASVLKSSVTVEQWMCIRIFQNSLIKSIENELIVIPVTNDIADNSSVAQIQNRTQIELVNGWTFRTI